MRAAPAAIGSGRGGIGAETEGRIMGPFSDSIASRTAVEEAEEARLRAARETFPGWRIVEVFGGFMAVPRESVILQSIDIDGLVGKLRQQEA